MSQATMFEWLSLKELAELTGLTTQTAREMVRAGEGPKSAILGKRRVFPKPAVQAWLSETGIGEWK